MLVYDSCNNAEAFVQRHVALKYWRRIDVEEIDLARPCTRRLDEDIKRHWGMGPWLRLRDPHRFASGTHTRA